MRSISFILSESCHRVQGFLDGNADAVPSVNDSDTRRQLDTAVGELEAAATAQDTAKRELRGEVNLGLQLETRLERKYLSPLATFARASLKGVPDFAALTPATASLTGARLVVAARGLADAAENYSAKLAQAKFPKSFLDELRAAADAVEASIGRRREKRALRISATKRTEKADGDCRLALRTLDSLVRHHILGNEVLERGWRTAKRLRRADGSSADARAQVAPAAPGTTVTAKAPPQLVEEQAAA